MVGRRARTEEGNPPPFPFKGRISGTRGDFLFSDSCVLQIVFNERVWAVCPFLVLSSDFICKLRSA